MPSGTLYLVGTPIGNLKDFSPRGREVLAAVGLIAAEDTRHTRRLLSAFDLHVPLESYHEHNLRTKGPQLVLRLLAGTDIALVSDAGMPCVSDPGSDLVALCVEAGVPVVVVPGPAAFVAGLAGSALDTARFVFEGFLPAAGRTRRQALAAIASEPRTIVLYESPHHLRKTLSDLVAAELGPRRISLCRELTKIHEEFLRTTVQEAAAIYIEREPRGEFCLVLEGADAFHARMAAIAASAEPGSDAAAVASAAADAAAASTADALSTRIARLLAEGFSVKDAAAAAASEFGLPKREAYTVALALRAGDPARLV